MLVLALHKSTIQMELASNDLGPASDNSRLGTDDAATWMANSFHPNNIATQVAKFIGPYLNTQAKARTGGVRVRASFCLGTHCQDIFDFDVRIGKDDRVLGFLGPKEDSWEGGRSREKLKSRRWF